MNKRFFYPALAFFAMLTYTSCNLGKKQSGNNLPNDGQLHGVAPGKQFTMPRPLGMVYVPSGTFKMGPSEEDPNHNFNTTNQPVTISGFWMDATEITNNEYRQFTNWVRDSIAATILEYFAKGAAGSDSTIKPIDWKKAATIKWNEKKLSEDGGIMLQKEDMTNSRSFKLELDASKIVYHSERFDYKSSAQNRDKNLRRSAFIIKQDIPIYPDTLCWVRDISYSYNEPMSEQYYAHPAFGNYPVVGVNWKQANAFCEWRSNYMSAYYESKNKPRETKFRLPSEAQWEYAARGSNAANGSKIQTPYPWGGPYLRNKKGCLLANFKPGRGNYSEDGGIYTVRADAYWPNDYGLYCMAGNVAEWTSSLYSEESYSLQHQLNPQVLWDAKETDPPRMKRKSIRGGSWKDVGHFLRNGTRSYEYQDNAKSYIGFRCVLDLPAATIKRGRR